MNKLWLVAVLLVVSFIGCVRPDPVGPAAEASTDPIEITMEE